MTKYAVWFGYDGIPILSGPFDETEGFPMEDDRICGHILVGATIANLGVYWVDVERGELVKLPGASPSPFHRWNVSLGAWEDSRTSSEANAAQWPIVRTERNQLLQASDWTQLPDVPLTTKEAWAAYRQALRDVTLQPDPFNIVWPTPPA